MKASLADAYKLLHEGALALSEIETAGMRVDVARLDRTIADVSDEIAGLEESMRADPLWKAWRQRHGERSTMGSRAQLSTMLADELSEAGAGRTRTGRVKVDEDSLEKVDLKFVRDFLEVERLKKLRSTNLMGIKRELVGEYLRPSFNLHLVKTYRSSCDSPNSQNLPKRNEGNAKLVRSCFIPRDGHVLVEHDFGALEFRISACVVGNTLVETIDGPQEIKSICSRVVSGDEVFVYGYSNEKGRLAVARVKEGGLTRRKAHVWKVVLDNGESVTATPDHKFMLRDGIYRELQSLVSGDSLMPFYSRTKRTQHGTQYTQLYLNNGKKILAHNLIALDVFGLDVSEGKYVVHHWNGNGACNRLDNIEVMSRQLHMKIHSKQGWKRGGEQRRAELAEKNKSDVSRARIREINSRRKEEWTPAMWAEWRRRLIEGIRRNGGHSGSRNGMYGRRHTEESKQKQRLRKLGIKKNRPSWNAGLTKETSSSVKKISDANKGKPGPNKGVRTPSCWVEVPCKCCGAVMLCSRRRIKQFCNYSCTMTYRHRNGTDPVSMSKHNHKVVSVESAGVQDVYNITVDGIHNYATTAGVIVKNCFWGDPAMIAYASDPALDIHRDMAGECYMLDPRDVPGKVRFFAKNQFVFPTLYGSYWRSTARGLWSVMPGLELADGTPLVDHVRRKGITVLGTSGRGEGPQKGTFEWHVKRVEERFCDRFPVWAEKKEAWWLRYQRKGWFPLVTGFRCSGVYSRNQLYNTPIQGPAFHCLLWSLTRMVRWLQREGKRSVIIGQIHDSMIGDVHRDELEEYLAKARQVMTRDIREAWPWIVVPLEVEADVCERNWFEKRKSSR